MTWKIVCHYTTDGVTGEENRNELVVVTRDAQHPFSLRTDFTTVLKKYSLRPSPVVLDLFRLAAAVYSADKGVLRGQEGYDGLTRDFLVEFPVTDLPPWNRGKPILEKALSFLTGDRWRFDFRQEDYSDPILKQITSTTQNVFEAVSLFSGGLDSFVGAIDLAERIQGRIALVGHHGLGGTAAPSQNQAFAVLEQHYGRSVELVPVYIQPPQRVGTPPEDSTRSRSFLFFALGVMIANSSGEGTPLFVSENGFVSLNVPLITNRSSSLSTRTTHPYFVTLFENLLTALGITTAIELPYRFKTKGETLLETENEALARKGYGKTLSCSHTSRLRWRGLSPLTHCGVCIPCLVRRAATRKAGFKPDDYYLDVLSSIPRPSTSEGEDLWAVGIALERLQIEGDVDVFRVLDAGPLPGSAGEIENYVDVYRRGLNELYELLQNSPLIMDEVSR